MELKDTIEMMRSADYKERFKAEYHQTKVRYDKLHKMLVKAEAGTLEFDPTCPLWILKEQKAAMGKYLNYLEIRAEVEKIYLLCDSTEGEDTTELPSGPIKNPKAKDHGYMGGYYIEILGEAPEEEITRVKETVVEKICGEIRKVAKESEDFFIIKKGERFPGLDDQIVTTVGAKFILPTVKVDYD